MSEYERKVVRIHQILEDGGHWFCCGEGETFVQAASELVDDETLTALLPLVETYARERATERLVQAALYFDGYAQTVEIALHGQSYVVSKLHEMAADPSELYPCECPREHCGDCGCCP